MKRMNRREFVRTGLGGLVAGALGWLGCGRQQSGEQGVPAVQTDKRYRWKMVTTWPPHFPVLGEGADLFARWVQEMSGGRIQIQVYGGGELVPALQVFDAVSQGLAEVGHGASYYWAGKVPAAQFFAAVPFGMNAQQMNAWLLSGGGLDLWRQVYEPFNLVPFLGGNTGVQMGGWFNKPINSIADFKGLKMRIPGLGGKVIARAGGSAVLSPGGEIFTNLERGVIDATEWIGPYHDYLMGFHKIARYYYYPGWHEPGTVTELMVNKSAYQSLSADLQGILRAAAERLNGWILAEFEAKNAEYLKKIQQESQVQIRRFPDEVLAQLKIYARESIEELTAKDEQSRRVYQAFRNFQAKIKHWSDISEQVYYQLLSG